MSEVLSTAIHWLAKAGHFLFQWNSNIAIAMVACLLVVLGSDINRVLRRNLSGQHFIVRTLAFIAVNAFGFGAFIVWASPFLARQLRALPAEWYFTVVVTVFIFVGIWAQRNRQI
ncbi:DUF3392 domain-containing protein [Parasalinivibrio latis]|uniref:DUF3392 domain-containing protein n=1 Tax=Parasalinivibrio latis TaxID=2952610 RepID=UPI0030DDF6FA